MLEYTPQEVSDELVAASSMHSPQTVVDFCAGNGSLLSAAHRRWPGARLFANDVDPLVYEALPNARWIRSDFLSLCFDESAALKFPNTYDLVLLNPPFSFQRTQEHHPRGSFSSVRCSVAFAFLFTALEYLNNEGELLAIMPTSTLRSDRDAAAREMLKRSYKCMVVSQPSYDRFPGLDVSTYLLSIRPRNQAGGESVTDGHRRQTAMPWLVTRGAISVRRANRTEHSGIHNWIHTTSIRSSEVVVRYELPHGLMPRDQKVAPKNSLVLPRVGRVKPGNLLVTTRREILSDCLLSVTFDDPSHPSEALRRICSDFCSFANIYGGTGAPYTTQAKVSRYIAGLLSDLVMARVKGATNR
jgi:Methyltransferase small domain